MPASKRRRTSGPVKASGATQQSTLSFRSSKARPAADVIEPAKPSKQPALKSSAPNNREDTPEIVNAQNTTSVYESWNEAERLPQFPEVEVTTADEEEKELDKIALALTESRIKAYWAAKERERKAPRVHQRDLSDKEKVLREFDMSSRYGPSIGISRLSRWRRAHSLGMRPPIEVLAVLLKESKVPAGESKTYGMERSVIDELIMSSRARGDAIPEA